MTRDHYPHFQPILTRWQDNDVNGHIASATVYAFFDTTLQALLAEHAGIDPQSGEVTGFVVSSSCDFYAAASFPECLEVGVRVARLAGSTVEFELALFQAGEPQPCAAGRVVQVFVERETSRPASLPMSLQRVLQALQSQALVD